MINKQNIGEMNFKIYFHLFLIFLLTSLDIENVSSQPLKWTVLNSGQILQENNLESKIIGRALAKDSITLINYFSKAGTFEIEYFNLHGYIDEKMIDNSLVITILKGNCMSRNREHSEYTHNVRPVMRIIDQQNEQQIFTINDIIEGYTNTFPIKIIEFLKQNNFTKTFDISDNLTNTGILYNGIFQSYQLTNSKNEKKLYVDLSSKPSDESKSIRLLYFQDSKEEYEILSNEIKEITAVIKNNIFQKSGFEIQVLKSINDQFYFIIANSTDNRSIGYIEICDKNTMKLICKSEK